MHYFIQQKSSVRLLATAIITTLFSLGSSVCCALNYQASAYLGGTSTTIGTGKINLIGETDLLIPNSSAPNNDLTWGFGAACRGAPPRILQVYDLLHEVSFGLDLFYFQTKQFGDVWQYQIPEFNNFSYQLPINSLRLLIVSEWTLKPIGTLVSPFIAGGIGFAQNTSSFYETPVPTYLASGLSIASHTQYEFAYTVGGGLKFDLSALSTLTQHTQLSFRYLYANLGHVESASTANIQLASPLSASLYTQTWVAGLTYLF